PNTKALWTRLAAETGLVGLAIFLTWLLVLWNCARSLGTSPDRLHRALASFGQFVLVALLIEGFSVDTFALPYFWLALGIMTAAFQHWAVTSSAATPAA
ncbi:MAG: hypothetical protein ACYCX1_13665, partial [Bellilinea sp.]